MKTEATFTLKDSDQCKIIAGTHAGKYGTVGDINSSKTGHITIMVVQKNGDRFKTLGKNAVPEKKQLRETVIMKKTIYSVAFALLSQAAFAQAQPKPFVLGVIDEIQSSILSEKRILNIYLPEGYNEKDTLRYPIIYLLDGSADEDFIHIVGLVQFNSFAWINRVPKSIVVGIANIDRKKDFTYPTSIEADKKRYPTTGHSDKFISFVEKELQPFIEKKYKTGGSKTIIGESLGGLLATEILLKKPALFNKYIIISPSLWWDDGSLLRQSSIVFTNNFHQKTGIYIAAGKEGLAPGETPHVMEVDANVLADKIIAAKNKNVKVYFDYLPQENHATIGHQAVLNAFKILQSDNADKEN